MTLNPAGYVPLMDFGNPKLITAKARGDISGGAFVFASGATGIVSSGANSFNSTDIEVATDASGAQFIGLAMQSATSGGLVTVALEAVAIVTANGAFDASTPVACDGNNSVLTAGSVAANLSAQRVIGRALTAAASGGYCIVHFK